MLTRGARDIGIVVALAVAVLAPLLAGTALVLRASSESPLESAAKVAPLVGRVEPATRSREASVAIAVEYAHALSPVLNVSGTLTAVPIVPGGTVATGAVVVDVDGRHVVAYSSDAPLWRDIAPDTKGPDVVTAEKLLKELGLLAGAADDHAGHQVGQAIKAFNVKYGYGGANSLLSLGSLLWIGTGPVEIGKVSVALGDRVSPETAVFTTSAVLAAITVSETQGVARDGEVELAVNGIVTPYKAGTGRVTDAKAVAAIAKSLGTDAKGVGAIRLIKPVKVGMVPSSAVVTDEAGRTCIFADVDSAPRAVEPRGGSLGTVDLDPSLVGEPVLVNPRQVRKALACG